LTVAQVLEVIDVTRSGSCEEAPRGAGFVDDVIVAFEHGDGEFVAA
jgi:hypothetical protein